ncbi:hypothetical protein MFMK1_000520 [Metallumcola ferriviriculae]|uniref:Uncharacterized protein n=1 Tax=Metallumcola ferriviriculae TaxID=3039180 RepID=A0AAU0UKG2_9FIRM|nr:hypothetical protein MFMK1_000520 [Desulfitibacteraceae bacterium MK1]
MRTDGNVEKFREWLRDLPSYPDKDLLKAYYESFSKIKGDNLPVKTLRFGIPAFLGLLGPIGTAISVSISVADAFWGNRVINGWNPKLFIEKHFRYK